MLKIVQEGLRLVYNKEEIKIIECKRKWQINKEAKIIAEKLKR